MRRRGFGKREIVGHINKLNLFLIAGVLCYGSGRTVTKERPVQ